MQHLNEEQLVLHHYRDDETPALAEAHLRECGDCRSEYTQLKRVLDAVSAAEIPEPGDAYAEKVWNRLRWKLGRKRSRWPSMLAAAAVLAVVFFAGQWWQARSRSAPTPVAQVASNPVSSPVKSDSSASGRVLIVVVSDHFESSERMLVELANADPSKGEVIAGQQERAAELLADNRIYRQSAAQRGDARLAALLSDLEPVLTELAHANGELRGERLAEMQRRIEGKGLIFKVRVASAQTGESDPNRSPIPTNSL